MTQAAAPIPSRGTMRRDIASAYVVTGARVASWVVVSAVVYRKLGPEAFAMVALVRATMGLLSYVSLGVGPAMVRLLSAAEREPSPVAAPLPVGPSVPPSEAEPRPTPTLAYSRSSAPPPPGEAVGRVYATGEAVAMGLAMLGLVLAAAYAHFYERLHDVPTTLEGSTRALALLFGVGVVFRVISEAPAGLLQVRGRIVLDNLLQAAAEATWALATVATFLLEPDPALQSVGVWFVSANLLLLAARAALGRLEARALTRGTGGFDPAAARSLLAYGGLVVLAQLADFLYAPVDYILINRLIDPAAVAVYAPAVQIDSGLLLLVMAVANVLLPKAATAHAAGDVRLVRRYYLAGTATTAALLAVAALAVWAASPWIFRLWLGDSMPATRAILPLVLIATVVGGSGAVGRAVLLGTGRAGVLAVSVLVAGVGNVFLGYAFVRHLGWGLNGIVLATVLVVTARAGVWLPWYVLRTLPRSTVAVPPAPGKPVAP